MSPPQATRWLPWLVFAVLAPLTIGARGETLSYLMEEGPTEQAVIAHSDSTHSAMGYRVGGPLLYLVIEGVLRAAAGLMMVEPSADPSFLGTPWGVDAHSRAYFYGSFIPTVAFLAFRLLLLVSIPVLAGALFRSSGMRALAVALMLVTIGGWPSAAVSAVFQAGAMVVDWPKAYYLFSHRLAYSDLPGMAFLAVLAAWMARREAPTLIGAAIAAAIGQAVYEHLGFVTGVAVFLQATRSLGLKAGFSRFVAAGVGAVAALGLLMALRGIPVGNDGSFSSYLDAMWTLYGMYNVRWWNVLLANLASMLALPVLFGSLLGILARALPAEPLGNCGLSAVVAVFLAIIVGMLPGIYVSGFAADLGRQALALAVLAGPMAALVWARRGRSPCGA